MAVNYIKYRHCVMVYCEDCKRVIAWVFKRPSWQDCYRPWLCKCRSYPELDTLISELGVFKGVSP